MREHWWGLFGCTLAATFLGAVAGGTKHVLGVHHLFGWWAVPFVLAGSGLGYLLGRAAA